MKKIDSTIDMMINDLQKELQLEMQKSFKKRDYDKIAEIAETICLFNDNKTDKEKIDDLCEKIHKNTKPHKRIKMYKNIAVITVCLAFVFGGNAYTMNAYGDNLFSLLITRDSSGIVINFNYDEKNNVKLPKIKNDPYGMIAKCAEYGVYPDTPLYIPDGFELIDLKIKEYTTSISIMFNYKKMI